MTEVTTAEGAALVKEIEAFLAEARQDTYLRPEVVDEKEAARIIGVSVSWLRNERRSPSAPPFCKLGNRVRYRVESLRDWVRQQEVRH